MSWRRGGVGDVGEGEEGGEEELVGEGEDRPATGSRGRTGGRGGAAMARVERGRAGSAGPTAVGWRGKTGVEERGGRWREIELGARAHGGVRGGRRRCGGGKERPRGEKKKVKKRKEKKRGKRERRGKKERKKGGRADSQKGKRRGGWLQKGRGWERKFLGGNPRVWRFRWAWAGLGYSLASQIFFSFCKFNLAINFRKQRRTSR